MRLERLASSRSWRDMPFDLLVLSQLAADEDGRFPTNPMIRVYKKAHGLRKILVSFPICLNRLDSLFL